jgi:hypothetical protein
LAWLGGNSLGFLLLIACLNGGLVGHRIACAGIFKPWVIMLETLN